MTMDIRSGSISSSGIGMTVEEKVGAGVVNEAPTVNGAETELPAESVTTTL